MQTPFATKRIWVPAGTTTITLADHFPNISLSDADAEYSVWVEGEVASFTFTKTTTTVTLTDANSPWVSAWVIIDVYKAF